MSEQANARIYRLRELPELIQQLGEMRSGAMKAYRAELRRYNKARAGRPEVERPSQNIVEPSRVRGFEVKVPMGGKALVPRPTPPRKYDAWFYMRASEFFSGGDGGLLRNGGKYNRPMNAQRVREYRDMMMRGLWRDNITDPICITPDGEVINGQHRIAAVGGLKFDDNPEDGRERVLVLFDVDPAQIAFADTSKRTARDHAVMAAKRTVKEGAA